MKRDRATLDLFGWTPPAVVKAFAPEQVRAASLRATIARAITVAMKESGRDRDTLASLMSRYLGEDVKKGSLDTCASNAREDHTISVVRLLGLVHATGDMRLLQLLAAQFGFSVVPDKYLPAIEEAMLADQIEELSARRALARKSWKGA